MMPVPVPRQHPGVEGEISACAQLKNGTPEDRAPLAVLLVARPCEARLSEPGMQALGLPYVLLPWPQSESCTGIEALFRFFLSSAAQGFSSLARLAGSCLASSLSQFSSARLGFMKSLRLLQAIAFEAIRAV